MKRFSKSKTNMCIDIVMFMLLMPITGIGLLMKYVLVAGSERNIVYGKEVDLLFCGLDRHQWGDIHLLLSYLFLALMVLHIVLHWKMICQLFKKLVTSSVLRVSLMLVFVFLSLGLGVMPLFLKPEIYSGYQHHAHQPHQHQYAFEDFQDTVSFSSVEPQHSLSLLPENKKDVPSEELHPHHNDINGQMTLHQLAQSNHLSEKDICQHFAIPESRVQERLGRLRKRYGFSIEDLRTYVNNKD